MFFLIGNKIWGEIKRRRHPEKYAEEVEAKDKALREFLKSHHIDTGEESEQSIPMHKQKKQDHQKQAKPKPSQQKIAHRPQEKFHFKSSLEDRRHETAIEKRSLHTSIHDNFEGRFISSQFHNDEHSAYDTIKVRKPSVASKIVHQLPHAKNMLVIKEIFGPPLSMRDW